MFMPAARDSRIHPVLDELQETVLILVLGCQCAVHNMLPSISAKLIGLSDTDILTIFWIFILEFVCSKVPNTERVRNVMVV